MVVGLEPILIVHGLVFRGLFGVPTSHMSY